MTRQEKLEKEAYAMYKESIKEMETEGTAEHEEYQRLRQSRRHYHQSKVDASFARGNLIMLNELERLKQDCSFGVNILYIIYLKLKLWFKR
jgi:hypothetical protein